MLHFSSAPWPTSLKVSSILASLLLIGVAIGAVKAVPPSGFARYLGIAVASTPPLIGLVSLLFLVQGYDLDGSRLCVRRLLWSTVIPLHGLKRVWHESDAVKCSARIFGNAGLFSFTGLYQNPSLGRFRLFGTDPARAVVLSLPHRVIVITPASPQALVEYLSQALPDTCEKAVHLPHPG
jgi:hypothetical protein